MSQLILIRGGGDLATGVAIRLLRIGLKPVITEISQPLAVRRTVSFAEAVYQGQVTVENYTGRCVTDPEDTFRILNILSKNQLPVMVDPDCISAKSLHPGVIVDARMTKKTPDPIGYSPSLYIGLGPGFIAGVNCQAVIETRRCHQLGRVFWQGSPEPDTGYPEGDPHRILRAPVDGILLAHASIGQILSKDDLIAEVNGHSIRAPFSGLLRGLIHPGIQVMQGWKVGDVDPRVDPSLCTLVSDKAFAVGGGVVEAILSKPDLRKKVWD